MFEFEVATGSIQSRRQRIAWLNGRWKRKRDTRHALCEGRLLDHYMVHDKSNLQDAYLCWHWALLAPFQYEPDVCFR